MNSLTLSRASSLRRSLAPLAALLLLSVAGAALWAQVSGERGIAPVASSTDIEVRDIQVNVTGDTAEDARVNGWREAQRLAWKKLGGPEVSDGQLDSMISAIIVQRERLGPRRYIATLGVVFDRARAGALIAGEGERARSAPMLTLPVMISGGTQTMFEVRNPWQRAWAEYQTGASAVDYVRPSGSGTDSLLLTYGQTGRRSRVWWNDILDQFGAADVLVPIANLRWIYPGGPVEGEFTGRHGPDNKLLGRFTLRAANAEQLPAMLDQAVRRFDAMFTRALASGILQPDPTLALDAVDIPANVLALIEASRRAEAEEAARRAGEAPPAQRPEAPIASSTPLPEQEQPIANFSIQVATPDAAAIDTALASLRSVPGSYGVGTNSVAVGGTSVMRISYAGDLAALAAALRERGWNVTQGANTLAITR